MASAETVRKVEPQRLLLEGQEVEWRLVRSSTAKKLRIKVGLDGIVVVLPEGRDDREAVAFIGNQRAWVGAQLARLRQLQDLRRPLARDDEHILFRGETVAVRVVPSQTWRAPNKVVLEHDAITVICKVSSKTAPARSLENWLRKQARERIEQYIADVGKRLKRAPNRIYVMGQRTKWGNCSSMGNLSFNWRLVMAPDFVLRYIVTHEMVHLAVPDHSRKFWLTVQSLCSETERARQWLVANGQRIQLMEPAAATAQ
ncbi:M48 family metallopeptidase [Mesorhizobium qingshengii]|uniref:M48 family metallopeptidase n=1 Tax=Mesorhizobium qingshengii TaxID=1165689 RepID=A0ABT4QXJ6_9HYPH|nr:M48 family metallopeptidase [Mesorhizobium qingshengii]MCZ8546306.1 M48 family metallopeptidase [Mesorhizobium qingshengii]